MSNTGKTKMAGSKGSGFRYSVCTNSLPKEMSVADIADLCVQVGADGVEWGLPALDKAGEVLKQITAVSADRGLGMAGFTCSCHLWKMDPVRQWSELLASAGVKRVRLSPPWMAFNFDEALHQRAGYMELFKLTREGLEKLVPLSREYGIRYLIETHRGNVAASPAIGRQLAEGLDPAAVGFIYDAANGVAEGGMRPRNDIELLGPYLAYVHAKNFRAVQADTDATPVETIKRASWRYLNCLLHEGIVDWVEVCFALKYVGYSGWVSLEEFFKGAATPAPVIRDGLRFLKECAAAAPSAVQPPYTTFND